MASGNKALESFMEGLEKRNPGEPEFHQAVMEVAATIIPFLDNNPEYREMQILERMAEPDRVVSFRVCWEDDKGNIRVNRGHRIQMNNAIGPYKGGLRFHPSVNTSVLKFLAFEQTFKNSLTGLPMGAGKGGANFNPKGKSANEVMRFCQSFVTELYRHIGANVDVPAGDIGVGAREIGYMFGQFKRITNSFEGVLTGKGIEFGGSLVRNEATGYGAVYFMQNMLKAAGNDVAGKVAVVSGSGNVATHAAEKLMQLGARPVTLSDSGGYIHDPAGFTQEKLDWIKDLKNVRRGRISEYCDEFKGSTFHKGKRPWEVPCELAMPCATQNELNLDEAKMLIKNGVVSVSEGANMPTSNEGVDAFLDAGVIFGPAKAANAGGVAVSGLEMSQNSARISWGVDQMQEQLRQIMEDIHGRCENYGKDYGRKGTTDYVAGANIAGFAKVASAMMAFGVV
ncbi:MAG: NADP-specific glutamate dehydrogenase [Minwuia sp.]|nr:NADP-specific glutamate dehydrogenase [Minwuia sp.]